jgi:hypothetical protein
MALIVIGLVAVVLLLLTPDAALAWGPVTHLVHGATVLGQITNLPASLQEILRAHTDAYLYGCVGADIINAKKFTRDLRFHCHSWRVGWRVLESASSDTERAFAYGYLTHLAADTFSHNYYIPLQLIVSFSASTLKHVYWEARFDAMQPTDAWQRLRTVVSGLYPECDDHMERVVERTLFSFKTNKKIFNSVMALQRARQWRRMMQRVGTRSRYVLAAEEVARYDTLCSAAAVDVLRFGKQAPCLVRDPTGRENLARAQQIRRRLRALRRRRQLTPELRESILSQVVPELKAAIQ